MHVNRYRFNDPPPLAQVLAQRILSRPPRALHPEEIAEAVRQQVSTEADPKRTASSGEAKRESQTSSRSRESSASSAAAGPSPEPRASAGHVDVTA